MSTVYSNNNATDETLCQLVEENSHQLIEDKMKPHSSLDKQQKSQVRNLALRSKELVLLSVDNYGCCSVCYKDHGDCSCSVAIFCCRLETEVRGCGRGYRD